jgi:hypothetical protein
LDVADYVRFGCGGLCAVAIGTYRKLLAGALKITWGKQKFCQIKALGYKKGRRPFWCPEKEIWNYPAETL